MLITRIKFLFNQFLTAFLGIFYYKVSFFTLNAAFNKIFS
jgi:hypothetical protein